jgi:hypothetical protein
MTEPEYFELWDLEDQKNINFEKQQMNPQLRHVQFCQYVAPFIDIVRFKFTHAEPEIPNQNFIVSRVKETYLAIYSQNELKTDQIFTSYYPRNHRNEMNFLIYGSAIYKNFDTFDSLFLLYQFEKGKFNYEQELVCAHYGCAGFNIKILNMQLMNSLDYPFELLQNSLNQHLLSLYKLEQIKKPKMDHIPYLASHIFMNYSIEAKALMSYYKFLKLNDRNSLSFETLLYHYEKLKRIRESSKGFENGSILEEKFGDIDVKIDLFNQAKRKKKVYAKQYNLVLNKLSNYLGQDISTLKDKYLNTQN